MTSEVPAELKQFFAKHTPPLTFVVAVTINPLETAVGPVVDMIVAQSEAVIRDTYSRDGVTYRLRVNWRGEKVTFANLVSMIRTLRGVVSAECSLL